MIFLYLFFMIVTLILYSYVKLLKDARKLNLPGPFPLPIVGNGNQFFGDNADFMTTFQYFWETYGGICRFYILSKRYVLISDPKYIEAITTSTELLDKGRSYDFLHPWLGRGLLTSTGNRWKTHRKFLTPAFHFNILQTFFEVFLQNDRIFIKKLQSMANGREIDLFSVVALLALDNVTESIMGVSINAQTDSESEYVKAISEISDITSYRMRHAFAAEDAIFNLMPSKIKHDKAIETLHKHSRNVIETRRKELQKLKITVLDHDGSTKNKNAFLDLLLLAEINGKKIDDESVREEVDTFMFEEIFLPDHALVVGRFMLAAWELGLEGAEDDAADIIVVAVQNFLKNVIAAAISQRKGYKMRNNHFMYDVGGDVPNMWLRSSAKLYDPQQEGRVNVDDGPDALGPRCPPTIDELEQSTAMEIACSLPNAKPNEEKLTIDEIYNTLLTHKNVIACHSVYAVNMERMACMLNHPSY